MSDLLTIEEANRLVEENRRLAFAMARKFRIPAGVDIADVEAEAELALVDASRKFRPGLGYRFSTFACRIAYQRIMEYLGSSPAGAIMTARGAFAKDASAGVRRAAERARRSRSLDSGLGPVGPRAVMEYRWDADPAVAAETNEIEGRVRAEVARLSRRQQEVLQARFREGLTLRDTGERLGVTKERVRQIQEAAIVALRRNAAKRLI